jgi:hypothetical protein
MGKFISYESSTVRFRAQPGLFLCASPIHDDRLERFLPDYYFSVTSLVTVQNLH